jgi:predicted chitinase
VNLQKFSTPRKKVFSEFISNLKKKLERNEITAVLSFLANLSHVTNRLIVSREFLEK